MMVFKISLLQVFYTRQKRNAPCRTVQLSGRLQVIGKFRFYAKVYQVLLHFTSFAIRRQKCGKENWPQTKWALNGKVTENKHFYNALLLDKFNQMESSQ